MYKDYSTKKDRLKRKSVVEKFVKYLKASNNFKLIL
jgi:hypothetical protein